METLNTLLAPDLVKPGTLWTLLSNVNGYGRPTGDSLTTQGRRGRSIRCIRRDLAHLHENLHQGMLRRGVRASIIDAAAPVKSCPQLFKKRLQTHRCVIGRSSQIANKVVFNDLVQQHVQKIGVVSSQIRDFFLDNPKLFLIYFKEEYSDICTGEILNITNELINAPNLKIEQLIQLVNVL